MNIISTAMGFPDTTFSFVEIKMPKSLVGHTSYINHPATKKILEELGAETVQGKMSVPRIGQSYLAVSLRDNIRPNGYTEHVEVTSVEQLRVILCTRIE